MSGVFVELLEGFSIPGLPNDEPVCAAAVYNGRRRRWAGKLRVLREDQQPVPLEESTIGNELLALGNDVRTALGR